MTIDDAPTARSAGPSFQQVLDTDARAVPVALRDTSAKFEGSSDVAKSRYTSPAFAALEHEYVWKRTWQMGCHVSELPKPGSHVVFDIGDESLIITRGNDDVIRAFHNSCLHRGTKLRCEDGRVASFRCPFHGWTWSIDGELTDLPCEWDFPQVAGDPAERNLPEAQVALWGGFVMVNLDPACEPWESYADKLIEHFDDFQFDRRYVAFHAVKEVGANWKVVMEAFAEAYHVIATHPQIVEFSGDANSEYAVWADSPHVTRFVNAFAVQSPHLSDTLSEAQVAQAYLAFLTSGPRATGVTSVDIPEGANARNVVADLFRQRMGPLLGADLSDRSDSEMLDAILYNLFPAFAPWAGVGQSLVYRWRPGRTPDTSFMDVIRMAPLPDDGPAPPPAPCTVLTLDQAWSEAPGMGGLSAVFEQDMSNLHRVQAGLKSSGKRTVSFGNYQEARLRGWHRLLDSYISRGLQQDGRPVEELAPFAVPAG
jgi:phenylpropionate dioxygenase-like ring-hydroxylating dioxygenase large terminal subunit